MKRTFLFFLSFLSILDVLAQKVSMEHARQQACKYLNHERVSRAVYVASNESFYVFEDEMNPMGGFVIVSGDYRKPSILGFCDHGTFDLDDAPENFKWWISRYENEPVMTSTVDRQEIPYLIKTKWNQKAPYWNHIPVLADGSRALTGCVATAMAQVMKHYSYPEHGFGSHSYESDELKNEYSVDFSQTYYDWGNMLNVYGSGYSTQQSDAVAELMYHCGVAVEMDYNSSAGGGSGASPMDIAPALYKYFGYDGNMHYDSRSYYTDEEWEDKLYEELMANRPVLYGGTSAVNGGGHRFICDGYKDNLFHFNWGWGGSKDGYFALTSNSYTAGAPLIEYRINDNAVFGVLPSTGNEILPKLVVYEGNGLSLSKNSVNISSLLPNVRLSCSYYNFGTTNADVSLGVMAVNIETEETYYFKTSNSSIQPKYTKYAMMSFNAKNLHYNGTYRIYPVYRRSDSSSNEDWVVARIPLSVEIPVLTVTGGNDYERIPIDFDIDDYELEVGDHKQIFANSDYSGKLFFSSSRPEVATVSADGIIEGIAPGTCIITASGSVTSFYEATSVDFPIEVLEHQKPAVPISLEVGMTLVGMNDQVIIPDDYDGEVLYRSSDPTVLSIDSQGLITGLSVGKAQIQVKAIETEKYRQTSCVHSYEVMSFPDFDMGLMLLQSPLFSHENYPTAEDFNLTLTMYNMSEEESPVALKFIVDEHEFIDQEGVLAANAEATYVIDFTPYVSWFTLGETYTVQILKQKLGDVSTYVPMNIPSVTFTFWENQSYAYTLSSVGVGTLVLPFESNLPQGLHAYTCSSLSNGRIYLDSDDHIRRDVPYILRGIPGEYTFTGAGLPDAIAVSDGFLVGVLKSGEILLQEGDYILQNHNGVVGFYRIGGSQVGREAAVNRAFLRIPEGMEQMFALPDFPDETESIEQLPSKMVADGIYDLEGRLREVLQPGLNIVRKQGQVQKIYLPFCFAESTK